MAKQTKHVAPDPPEFRAEAIRLARTRGKPHAQSARELGMTGETVRLWLKPADLDEGKRSEGPSRDEQAELGRLRRENRILREEREILKQAAAHLPRRRPARSGERVPVRVERETAPHAVVTRCRVRPGLPQRLRGLAPAHTISASASGRAVDAAHPGDPSGQPRHRWSPAHPRGVGQHGRRLWPQAHRAVEARGRAERLSPPGAARGYDAA